MRTRATTATRRPGPLQELPLEHFLPADPALTARTRANPCVSPGALKSPPSSRTGKRSAASPLVLSPAKRRLMADEGVVPESVQDARVVPSTPRTGGGSGKRGSARFDALLRGTGSPARKLDFGAPGDDGGDAAATPGTRAKSPEAAGAAPRRRSERVRNKLAPSPELVRTPRLSASSSTACSSSASTRHATPTDAADPPATSKHVPLMIPRETPPLADPQSAHYPGFDIYVDTHILLPHVRDSTPHTPGGADGDEDGEKENAPVRRARGKKPASAASEDTPSGLQPDALSPSPNASRRARTAATSPRARMPYGADMRFGTFGSLMEDASPAKSERTVLELLGSGYSPDRTPRARSAARRLLLKEVDEVEGEEL